VNVAPWLRLEPMLLTPMLLIAALCPAAQADSRQSAPVRSAQGQVEQTPTEPPTEPSIPVSAAERAKLLRSETGGPAHAARRLPPRRRFVAGASLPPREALLTMVGSVMVAVNQANFTGDYSVLHALGTRELQVRTTASVLAKAFKPLRDQNIDLSSLLLLPAQFTEPPAIRADGVLRLAGYYPSRPKQVNFVIVYCPVVGYWRIDGLSVSTSLAGEASGGASGGNGQAEHLR
jgi:hypothetical protein